MPDTADTIKEPAATTITAYKGFDKDLRCRDFQFEVGKTYTVNGPARSCENGFHACPGGLHPLTVFGYYPPGTSRYHIVEQSGDICRRENDKAASTVLTVKLEIGIGELVKRAVQFVLDRCSFAGAQHATGDRSASLTTGEESSSEITSTNNAPLNAVAIATGRASKARAPKGSALVLVERSADGSILSMFASKIGENGIEADTFYMLRNGKPVAA